MAPPVAASPKNPAAKGNGSSSANASNKAFVFPVGAAGKRELKQKLRKTTDPKATIQSFQTSHSLHFMLSKAFGTQSIPESKQQQSSTAAASSRQRQQVESLDSDSVMTFLSHLGVSHYEVHKRISDTFLKQLEDEVRKTKSEGPLLELLSQSWSYAVTLPELRPIIWSVLRQLGEKTPRAVLHALAERQVDPDTGAVSLKHADLFRPLPALLKKLVWEGDWTSRFPAIDMDLQHSSPQAFLKECQSTLLYETMDPLLEQYCHNKLLCDSANRPFVASNRERRVLTTQRRALNVSSTATSSTTTTTDSKTKGLLGNKSGGSAQQQSNEPKEDGFASSSKAISQLRVYLSNSGGGSSSSSTTSASSASSYRPKLLYALMSILIARHGAVPERQAFLAGADHLHCTLVSDILLSASGPLPKAYHHVHRLARLIDECVQEGNISNEAIKKIQDSLKEIFLPDHDGGGETPQKGGNNKSKKKKEDKEREADMLMSNALQRQMNHIITAGIAALKESDPNGLFLNPVTDKIAPGYSAVIKKPICILDMEGKISRDEYKTADEFKQDVELMFKNCHDYNKGKGGQWFRGEALRQKKVFEEEIYPQARRLYQTEIVKRKTEEEERKRKALADGPETAPLERASKRRRKEKEEFSPSMPALAFMVLSDPFFVRIVLARVLREVRVGISKGFTLPSASSVVPSLLQLMHMARWSTQVCKVRANRYFVPSSGMTPDENDQDPSTFVPYVTLREDLPLLLRLLLESELDKRIQLGGDLHEAAQSQSSLAPRPIEADEWAHGEHLEVPVALIEGALVHIAQPGSTSELSLATTFPKFASALINASSPVSFQDSRLFFQCLVRAVVRHKSKLSQPARDAIVHSWLSWLTSAASHPETKNTVIASAAHECLILLLNELSIIGNQILPRDTLLGFVADAVKAVETTTTSEDSAEDRQFATLWNMEEPCDFTPVKKQYQRMLNRLPASRATSWKEEMGIGDAAPAKENPESADKTPDDK